MALSHGYRTTAINVGGLVRSTMPMTTFSIVMHWKNESIIDRGDPPLDGGVSMNTQTVKLKRGYSLWETEKTGLPVLCVGGLGNYFDIPIGVQNIELVLSDEPLDENHYEVWAHDLGSFGVRTCDGDVRAGSYMNANRLVRSFMYDYGKCYAQIYYYE